MNALLTVPEVMERLKVGRTMAYRLIRSGELPSIKVGRARRVATTALDDFIAARVA
jgi:excisionase family DNA binding protein